MIRVAIIGFGRFPDFQATTHGTPSLNERIAWALLYKPVFRHACRSEGVDIRVPLKICNMSRREFEDIEKTQESERETKDGKKRNLAHSEGRNWMRAWRTKL
jgi:coenzyme A diphosphatase NUDT7